MICVRSSLDSYLRGNLISVIEPLAFSGLTKLEKLYLNANKLKVLSPAVFKETPNLKLLYLDQNLLHFEESESFPYLERLDWIDLGHNNLTVVSSHLLVNLVNLTKLHMQNNLIERIDPMAFAFNKKLSEVNLNDNRLESLPENLFLGLTQLLLLDLSMNTRVTNLPLKLFHDLKLLKSLNLTGISISNINRFHFSRNRNLSHLYFSRFKYCLFAPQARICHPSSDGVSSLEHLLVYPILRVSVWIVAFFTCLGNLTVITWRSVSRNEDAVLSLFVKNLSFADLLMGVYLVSIGLNDIGFQDQYLLYALEWMSSWKCSAIGFLAMTSSELSVLILTVVAIERYRSIAFNSRLLTLASARFLVIIVWMIALSIAGYPLIMRSSRTFYSSSVADEMIHGSTGYYGSNGLCFPLHIDDPYSSGWTFSAFVFLGVNLIAVLVMLILYTRMFLILNRDRTHSRPGCVDKHKEDVILALRFFFIVFTDCLCWLPIVVIKVIAFTSLTISPVMYAWVVVFVLPINSALNPILYTMAAPTEMRKRIMKQMSQALSKFSCCCWLFCPSCLNVVFRRDSNNSCTPEANVVEVYDNGNDDQVKRPSNVSLTSTLNHSMTNCNSNCGSRRGSVVKPLLNPNSNQSTLVSNCSLVSVSPSNNSSGLEIETVLDRSSQTFTHSEKPRRKRSLHIDIGERFMMNETFIESEPTTASTILSVTDTLSPKRPSPSRLNALNRSSHGTSKKDKKQVLTKEK